MKILEVILYSLLGLFCSYAGLTLHSWQFWAILGNVIAIDSLSCVRTNKCRDAKIKENE